ncbi:unnamed protein product [Pleuronectes platessa]|uniref:Uncharacterized protein n=1 Tax=Pleuronectes platessa TaxID=8262 RepID=A0A9N7UU98_PLEPL|nr:unnamed protein product [Pleuronectes platessa]
MQQQDLVTTVKAELLQALGEITAVKDVNLSLKEQVEALQEQLREKDGLVKKETRKRRARCKAYTNCLETVKEENEEERDEDIVVCPERSKIVTMDVDRRS